MAEATYLVVVGKRRRGKPAGVPPENVSRVVENYPNKVLAMVTASQHQELLRQGYRVEDISSRTKIRVGRLAIDPMIPKEREEAVGSPEEEEAFETEYHFVQFVGPVKPDWLEDLNAANLTPFAYYHDFTYLVSGEASNVEKLAGKSHIRTTMPYGMGFKLDVESRELAEEEEGEEEFWILVFTSGGKIEETLQEIERTGVRLQGERHKGAYFEKVRARIPYQSLVEITRLPYVFRIERYHVEKLEDEVADQITAGNYDASNEPFTGYIDWLNEMRIDGEGVTIGICDSGVDENHPAFSGRLTKLTTDTGGHGTMVAGQAAGDYRTAELPDVADDLVDDDGYIYGTGIAPKANVISRRNTGDDFDRARDIVTNAGLNGETGSIMNNSWGRGTACDDDPNCVGELRPMNYQSDEATYDELVRDADNTTLPNIPLIVCFSAGNDGDLGMTRPKAAKNPIVTGNFENFRPDEFGAAADDINDRRSTSSIGNCGDGRVKPDVVTPGHQTASAAYPQPGAISHWLRYGTGTSAASPKTAGACALLIQWWRQRHTVDDGEYTPSPALAKAMLISGAVDTGEGGPIPNEEQGWGRVHLNNVFDPAAPAVYVDQEILLQPTSTDVEFDLNPFDTTQPMKITLVWTDVPGPDPSGTGADPTVPGDTGNPALVNGLGLEVTQGTNTWFGNNFAGGWSQTGGHQDAIQTACPGRIVNNVQNVFIQNPDGTYHVRISPENITGNCLNPSAPATLPLQQDFALVIQNARLTTAEPVDVMLAIDRTGSMSGDRISVAIASGQEFFDLIPTGEDHRAGLVSYAVPCHLPFDTALADKVTVDVDMDAVTDALKTTAYGLIGGISEGGCTSIGAGLTKAMQRIVDNGEPLHRKVIILLSDGKENRPPYVSEILPRLSKEYRVHAVGLGGSINAALMQQIADDTHGTFLHTLDPDEIAPLYRELLALEADEEVVGHESGSFPAGEEEEEAGAQGKRFPIVNSDSQATFVVGWKNPDVSLDVELLTPRGDTINPTRARRSRTKSYVERDTHVIYTVRRPRGRNPDWEGEWAVRVRRASGSATVAETYTASALVRSSLRLKLFWDKAQYFTKDLIRLKAQIIDNQYVLRDGVMMAARTTVPLMGYGTTLASAAKKAPLQPTRDRVGGPLAALDRLNEEEWQALYAESEEETRITFEVSGGDAAEPRAAPVFTTPHVAKLKRMFRPLNDGIYTYRIRVDGRTASGAQYARVRTVSKYIVAKVDAKESKIVMEPVRPQQPRVLRFAFTPKDLHGNLVGPGRAAAISVAVDKGILKGEVEDLLDGSYVVGIEATERPEEMAVTIAMDDVSIPVSVPAVAPPVVTPVATAELEGKVEQLCFDERGNFLGFTLRTLGGTIDFPSLSSRLAEMLSEAIGKNLTVVITQDESTGEVAEVRFEAP